MPSAGFSVVTYTGTGSNATVGHGLGVAPYLVIAKAQKSVYWYKLANLSQRIRHRQSVMSLTTQLMLLQPHRLSGIIRIQHLP
jgi:hypothetical protein